MLSLTLIAHKHTHSIRKKKDGLQGIYTLESYHTAYGKQLHSSAFLQPGHRAVALYRGNNIFKLSLALYAPLTLVHNSKYFDDHSTR